MNQVNRKSKPRDRTLPADIEGLARLLDTRLRVPGTEVRFGLDALLGLLPAAGDLIAALLSTWLILRGARLGVPATGLARMLGNMGLDLLVGTIPLVGDVGDVFYRANAKNLDIIRQHLQPEGTGSKSHRSTWLLWLLVLGAIALVGVAIYATVALLASLLG